VRIARQARDRLNGTNGSKKSQQPDITTHTPYASCVRCVNLRGVYISF
jgi:hypothetical protein